MYGNVTGVKDKSINWTKIEGIYKEAHANFSRMEFLIREATRLTAGGRDFFYDWSPDNALDKETYIFDNTAQESTWEFVNMLHELLFPEQFFTFEVGENVPLQRRAQVAQELERLTIEFHKLIGETSFKTAITESLTDAAISTGFLEIKENRGAYRLSSPITFESSPMCKTYFSEVNGFIINTWRAHNEYFGSLRTDYPHINWDKSKYRDGDLVTLLDCCVHQPRSEKDLDPFVYYVAESDGNNIGKVLYTERRSYPARFGFGTDKFAIGQYREGQILKILPTIRMANGIAEMNWISIQYNSMPIMMYDATRFENPALVRIVPGAQLKINNTSENPMVPQSPPAAPIPFNLNAEASQLKLQNLQNQIQMALFVVGPPDSPVRSATEVGIQEQARQKGIARLCRRLRPELVDQLIWYSVQAFRRMGYLVRDNPMEPFRIGGGEIAIKYHNIFTNEDYMQTVNSINTYREAMQAWLGPQLAMQTIDMNQLPQELGERLNLPDDLVKSPEEISQLIATASQATQQAAAQNITQMSQQSGQAPPPQVNPIAGVA